MAIHHATLKKAQTVGVIMTEEDTSDGVMVRAFWAERNKTVDGEPGEKAADVLADMMALRTIVLEWPGFTFDRDDTDWAIQHGDQQLGVGTRLADALKEALDACEEQGLDPSVAPEGEEADEDEPTGRVIVAARYKAEYAARGNPNHCGDWLAGFMDGMFTKGMIDGKPLFDHEGFAAFLVKNGVELTGKWAALPESGQKGWQGRYRMNGRQKLEKVIVERGSVIHPDGTEIKVPADFLGALAKRHGV